MNSVLYVTSDKTKVYKCRKDIKFFYSKEELFLHKEELLLINQYWNEVIKENKTLFNGRVLSAINVADEEKEVKIWLAYTNYAHMLYSMNFPDINVAGCKAIASGGLFFTNDGYLVLGKMGQMTSFPGVIQCVGGGLEEKDICRDEEATISTVIRECEEEIGFKIAKKDTVNADKYIYIREKMSTIGICYMIDLDINKNELYELFKLHKICNEELEDLVFVNNATRDIVEFCHNNMLVDYLRSILFDYLKLEAVGTFDNIKGLGC